MSLTTLSSFSKSCLVLSREIADKILLLCDGDAALLYIYILTKGETFSDEEARRALSMDKMRYEKASFSLSNISLSIREEGGETMARREVGYTTMEVRRARTEDHRFAAVCDSAELTMGKALKEADLKVLLKAYDGLKLPPEVLIELLGYLKSSLKQISRKDIQRATYEWADMGIFTYDKALLYIQNRQSFLLYVKEVFSALGFGGREPEGKESGFLQAFSRMGFGADAVALAASRMLLTKGEFSWSYLNKILESWHEKNIHTLSEIESSEPGRKQTVAQRNFLTQEEDPAQWENAWLRERKAKEETRG